MRQRDRTGDGEFRDGRVNGVGKHDVRQRAAEQQSVGSDVKAQRRFCAAWHAIPDELTTQRMLLGAADFNGENLRKFEL